MATAPRTLDRRQSAAIGAACACFNLRRASRAVTQLYDAALRPTGLRSTQFSLLTMVRGFGTVRITQLALAAGMDHTTLGRNLRPLARAGFIRSHSGRDARVREVSLTTRGRRVLAPALALWERAQAQLGSRLGRAGFRKLLAAATAASAAAQTH